MLFEFENYDRENPKVYEMYKKYAREALAAGMKTLSISMLTERIRWEYQMHTNKTHSGGYKIANAHRAFYVRKLLAEEEFENRFVIKKSVADKKDFENNLDEFLVNENS